MLHFSFLNRKSNFIHDNRTEIVNSIGGNLNGNLIIRKNWN